MLQNNLWLTENNKFQTASIGCFLRLRLTRHNLAYANLLAHLQMNASLAFPSLEKQEKALTDLYDLQLEITPQIFGRYVLLTYLLNFVEPTSILAPDYDDQRIIRVAASIMRAPLFAENLLAYSKAQIRSEYQEIMQEPANQALSNFFSLWYQNEPDYADTFIGSLTEIEKAGESGLRTFAEQLRSVPAALVGFARNKDYVEQILRANFKLAGLIKPFGVKKVSIPAPELDLTKTKKEGHLQAQLLLGYAYHGPRTFKQQLIGSLLSKYLAGSQSSLLFNKVREQIGAAYAVEANFYAHNSLFLLSAGLDPGKIAAAEQIMKRALTTVQKGQIDASLLRKTKHNLLNEYITLQDQPNWQIGQMLRVKLFPGYGKFKRLTRIKQITAKELTNFAQNLSLNESYVLQ